jgi:hypothetical protein
MATKRILHVPSATGGYFEIDMAIKFIARIVNGKNTATIFYVPGVTGDYYKVIKTGSVARTHDRAYAFKLAGGHSIERNHRAHPLEHKRF